MKQKRTRRREREREVRAKKKIMHWKQQKGNISNKWWITWMIWDVHVYLVESATSTFTSISKTWYQPRDSTTCEGISTQMKASKTFQVFAGKLAYVWIPDYTWFLRVFVGTDDLSWKHAARPMSEVSKIKKPHRGCNNCTCVQSPSQNCPHLRIAIWTESFFFSANKPVGINRSLVVFLHVLSLQERDFCPMASHPQQPDILR